MYPASQSCPSASQLLFWNIFWKFSEWTLDVCSHLWLFSMSKFRILKRQKNQLLRLYRVAPLLRQQFNRENETYVSSQVKSALKISKKARIVTVLYSCQMYLCRTNLVLHIWINGSLYLLNFNALTKFCVCIANNWMEQCWTTRVVSVWEKRFYGWS